MTEPLDPDRGWRALVQQQVRELAAKDALIERLEKASAQQQIELDRLQVLLNEAHADADELLYPEPKDPDWYIEQQGADRAFHQMADGS